MPRIQVLLVDPLRSDRDALAEALGSEYAIVAVDTAAAALARVADQRPELVVVAHDLPDMPGLELLERLRGLAGGRDRPVFMLGDAADTRAVQALKRGAADHLLRSELQPGALRHAVRNALNTVRLRQRVELQRRRTEDALRASEARERLRADELEALMRAVPAALWIAQDPECRSVVANPEAHRLLAPCGAAATDPLDCTAAACQVIRAGRTVAPEDTPLRQAARQGVEVRGTELSLRFDDGSERRLYGNAVPLRHADGAVRGALAAFVDVSDRHAAEHALRVADRQKDEFLAMLAHELRNPLAAIRNAAETLGAPQLGAAEARAARELISRQSLHLSRLVDDLLDLSRFTSGKLALREEAFEAGTIVAAALEAVRPQLDARRHSARIESAARPAWLRGDPVRLTQVLSNLLDNAAKFTPAGGHILVRLGVAGEPGRGGQVRIEVEDDGIGIPPLLLPHVFEPYAQGERSRAGVLDGLGLGLTVVDRLVRMHGGSVTVDSRGEGQGSRFVVTLPLAAAADAVAAADELARRPAGPAGARRAAQLRRVLVVDDDEDAADSLAALLGLHGHQVRIARDGETALAVAAELQPEVVVADIALRGLDGYALARRLRTQPGGAGALLVAVTGLGRPEDRERALAAGFAHHLVKPVDPHRLGELIEQAAGDCRERVPGG